MNYLVIAIVALIIAGLSYLGYILLSNKEKLTDDDQCRWSPVGRSMPSADPIGGRYLYVIPNQDGENTYTFIGTDDRGDPGTIQLDKSLQCTPLEGLGEYCGWSGARGCLEHGGEVTAITPTGDTIKITRSYL
jgi:hypothetical protein